MVVIGQAGLWAKGGMDRMKYCLHGGKGGGRRMERGGHRGLAQRRAGEGGLL